MSAPGNTAIQFGLRSILGIMAAVAVFLAAYAPSLRAWDAAERQTFLVVWGTALLTASGLVGLFCRWRLLAQRQAGRVCFVLPQSNERRGYVGAAVLCVFSIGLVAVAAWLQQRQARLFAEMNKQGGTIPFSPLWSVPIGISLGMPLAMAGTALWWRTFQLLLCEHGVIYFVSFVPWSSIRYEFDDGSALLTLHVSLNRYSSRLRAVVPPELQQAVREMLGQLKPAGGFA